MSDNQMEILGWSITLASFFFIGFLRWGIISYLYEREIDKIYTQKNYHIVEGKIYNYENHSRPKQHSITFYVEGIKFNGRITFDRELSNGIVVRIKYASKTVKHGENTILEIEDINCVLPKL